MWASSYSSKAAHSAMLPVDIRVLGRGQHVPGSPEEEVEALGRKSTVQSDQGNKRQTLLRL